MGSISERARKMMENFMTHYREGDSITKIARRYKVSRKTVYDHLEDIAKKNGFENRDKLLKVARRSTVNNSVGDYEIKAQIDVEQLKNGLGKASDVIEQLIEKIDTTLEGEKNDEN